MADQQLHKTTLAKPDFVDFGFKGSLTAKVDELLKNRDVKNVETIKNKSIDRVITDTGLRRNKTKPHNLDQRCKSPENYRSKGLLKGTTGTLQENLKPDSDYRKGYHDEQFKLFKKLSKLSERFSFIKHYEQKEDAKGYWFLYFNNKAFSTSKFLNFIDKITVKYIEELRELNVKMLTLPEIEEKKFHLQTIAESCERIVMNRYLADMIVDVNLMNDEQTKLWRNHVAIIISFAALLVILEMLKLKLNPPNIKQNRTSEQTNEQSNRIEQRSVLIAAFGLGVIILLVFVLHRRKKINI